ncbi:hypothetical protein DSO57_1013822 [Entomophthora muscae]|uniref:Uncharacterized protein n=1 Tax=Entomophthora muscae TaxID=34485 RepID=A0ACC2TTA1_9FUNG|nr:hypothetical protein DSO57_1013822 [Entomophthora muscae]
MQSNAILFLLGLVSGVSTLGIRRRYNDGQVRLTYYWMAIESEFPEDNEQTTDLESCSSGETIKQVSTEYYETIKLEGSGQLTTGELVNCENQECTCFEVVDGGAKGNRDNPLQPYVSVASIGFPSGTKIYVEKLDGVILPSGLTHNGCVIVDDTGHDLDIAHIDMFVVSHQNYEAMDAVVPSGQVEAQINSSCEILDYTQGSPDY